jgi:hypothetical protein
MYACVACHDTCFVLQIVRATAQRQVTAAAAAAAATAVMHEHNVGPARFLSCDILYTFRRVVALTCRIDSGAVLL